MLIENDDAVAIRRVMLNVDDRDRWSPESTDCTVDGARWRDGDDAA